MKIALVSMEINNGDCESNMAYIRTKIACAIKDKCDLIVFPQNAISGYVLQDKYLDKSFCEYVDHFNEEIMALSKDIAIIWGNIKYRSGKRFNAAFYANEGISSMRVKRNDANQDYFEDSLINAPIMLKGYSLALNFGQETSEMDFNINIDCAPFTITQNELLKGNVCYVNSCGLNDFGNKVTVNQGGSYLVFDDKCLYQAKYFMEDYHVVDLNLQPISKVREKPQLLDALVYGIKKFDQIIFNSKVNWIIGLSGGLDSSISCALLHMALGNERIKTYYLGSEYNSTTTLNNAKGIAKILNIDFEYLSINELLNTSNHYFRQAENNDLFQQNLQARSRGFLLNGLAALHHGVVVNNGNRIERMMGYCTMYGDTIGALAIIGDLSKVELFNLASAINKQYNQKVIPLNLLPQLNHNKIIWENAPSAELCHNQIDPMKWFYHDYLIDLYQKNHSFDKFISLVKNGEIDDEMTGLMNFYNIKAMSKEFFSDLKWVEECINNSVYKRIQSPPYIAVHDFTQNRDNINQIKVKNQAL